MGNGLGAAYLVMALTGHPCCFSFSHLSHPLPLCPTPTLPWDHLLTECHLFAVGLVLIVDEAAG